MSARWSGRARQLLALFVAALMVDSALGIPGARAEDTESRESDSPVATGVAAIADSIEGQPSAPVDIGQSTLESVDPSAARAVGDAARAASPRGPRTYALPSGPSKTAVSPQAISLPNAEGSIEGMGESFSPVLSSGTGTFSVPIALPAGRAGVQPSLGLSYATSAGNGPVGIGWLLSAPFIARQTDRGLPRYVDRAAWHAEEDRFLYNGGQELVPVDSAAIAAVDCAGYPDVDCGAVPTDVAGWQQYRARVEGGFMRFFRAPDSRRWVVQSPDGTRFDFGELPVGEGPPEMVSASLGALETDEDAEGAGSTAVRTRVSGRGEGPGPRVYRWALTRMSDPHGSTVYYRYRSDQGVSYLDDIHYVSPHGGCGNLATPDDRRRCAAPLSQFGRRVRLVYETRPDAWSAYVSGWRMTTALRLRRIEVTAAEGAPGRRTLVRRYHFAYEPEEQSFHSLLSSVQVEGRPQSFDASAGVFVGDRTVPEESLGETIVGALLPPMRFGYSQPAATTPEIPGFGGLDATIRESSSSPAHSVDEARTDLFDVNSDGLPDVVITDPARYRTRDGRPAVGVFFNGFSGSGAAPGIAGGFSDAVSVPMPEALSGVLSLANTNLAPMDVDGDGRSDYLHMPRRAEYGYFTVVRDADSDARPGVSPAAQGWRFAHVPVALPAGEVDPRIDLGRDGSFIRVMDVNNDHLVDVVRTTGTTMQTWLNLGYLPGGDGRFGSATIASGSSGAPATWQLSTAPTESCLLRAGTPLDFADPEVRLGDMNGDGLQDIVRVRRGRVLYWPGRGEGLWGDGPSACARGDGADRHIEMRTPPAELDPEISAVYLEDVNEDGAADVVQVRFTDVDVWLNRAGTGFTTRITMNGTPPSPAFLDRVRFADIDGTGTSDIVWAVADRYRWIDPMGGRQPRLLVSVDNGLGALTTLQYGSSVEDYLTDLAAAESCTDASCERFTWSHVRGACDRKLESLTSECAYRSGGSPVVSTVVRAVETTDRFDALGREPNVTRTEYAYHDAYYEGIEQEHRGFGAAEARAIGDANHPTSITRSYFHQGRRPNDIATDRLADNPDEALKGRETLSEVLDEHGRYLSSSHASYVVRALLTGLDGRTVSYAYVGQTDELRYDQTPFSPLSGASLDLPTVRRERAGAPLSPPTDDPAEPVAIRGDRYAHMRSTTDTVDNLGHVLAQTAHGRIRGELGETPDERIAAHSVPLLHQPTRWMWRTAQSWTQSPASSVRLGHTVNTFAPTTGDLVRSEQRVTLESPSPYDFSGTGSSGLVQTAEPVVSSSAYDLWGNAVRQCGGDTIVGGALACLRYGEVGLDADYAHVPEEERIATGRDGLGGLVLLSTHADWDRGLGVLDRVTDPNELETRVRYDGLGRVTAVVPPSVAGCEGTTVPTTRIAYELTEDPVARPLSIVRTTTEQSCAAVGADPLETIAYVDGLGRARAALSEGDEAHAWVRSGLSVFDRKGTVRRAYQTDFLDSATPTLAEVVRLPATPSTTARYDAFGRQRVAIAEDGTESWTHYHALSTDACDALDNDPASPHFRTCSTARADGHGRVADQILRNRQPDSTALETYRLLTDYRADGAVLRIVRAETTDDRRRDLALVVGNRQSERTFGYDSLGRRLGSTDPDTDSRGPFATDQNRTWRYLFNRVGDLAAVRDPRGCGQDFFYDHAGRLLAERYVGCAEAQSAGETSLETVPAGAIALEQTASSTTVEVRYFFDDYPAWAPARPAGASEVLGRATGTSDRGQRSVVAYDDRGNTVWAARQMALLPDAAPIAATLSDPPTVVTADSTSPSIRAYDEAHTYLRTAQFDHAGRPLGMTLPEDPDWTGTGSPPIVGGTLTYNRRGLPATASATIDAAVHPIVTAVEYLGDGLVSSVTYGDSAGGTRAATVSRSEYDLRRRPVRMRTERAPTAAPSPERRLSEVSVVGDQEFVWDEVSNLVALIDGRDPTEWPVGQRPQTVTIGHDSLYRVTSASFDYTDDDGSLSGEDAATDWRAERTRPRPGGGTHESADPMRSRPAPMLGSIPDNRVRELSWRHDWLANTTEWRDDAHQFLERSIGTITNGSDVAGGRPSALVAASDLSGTDPGNRGGWLELRYGQGGNVETMTVHAECADSAGSACTNDPSVTVMHANCSCAREQHYQYRWDELNRLAEARRYDRNAPATDWSLVVRQRYRYDAANQRTVKATSADADADPGEPPERIALSVYPGDYERRGLTRGVSSYEASSTLGAETQYVVGGARIVWQSDSPLPGTSLDPDHRITVPLADLIQSTSAVLDLRTGDLLESATFYPNGARETHRMTDSAGVAPEPLGFTGKEADEEVGLVYFGERYLIPQIGRWASPDPLHVHAVGGGEALNSFHYVGGNLLQARDPLGLTCNVDESCAAESEAGNFTDQSRETVYYGTGGSSEPRRATRRPRRSRGTSRVEVIADFSNQYVAPAIEWAGYRVLDAGLTITGAGLVAEGAHAVSEATRDSSPEVQTLAAVGYAGAIVGLRIGEARAIAGGGQQAAPGVQLVWSGGRQQAVAAAHAAGGARASARVAAPGVTSTAPAPGRMSGVPGPDFAAAATVTRPYTRPSGAGPTAEQTRAVQGRPCVDCGRVTPRQVADHIDPLVVEYYRSGRVDVAHQSSVIAVQAHCPACSSRQGGQLSALSRRMARQVGERTSVPGRTDVQE